MPLDIAQCIAQCVIAQLVYSTVCYSTASV